MHQTVLMDADIDKCSEVNHIAHRAGQLHARREIGDIQHICAQHRRRQVLARITARLFQLRRDVQQRHLAHAKRLGELSCALVFHARTHASDASPAQILRVVTQICQQRLRRRIALRMHRRRVQRIAAPHAQESCTLLVRLRSELGHLLQLRTGGDAVFIAIGDDIRRQSLADARDMREQLHRRRLHIHADARHAALYYAVQRSFQFCLLEVMLILSHADCLGIDLHQLGKRILHASGN